MVQVDELIVLARKLRPADQQRLIDALQETQTGEEPTAESLAVVEALQKLPEIPIWSPIEAYEAAAVLMTLRDEANQTP